MSTRNTLAAAGDAADVLSPPGRVAGWRGRAAILCLALLTFWPAWSLVSFHLYLRTLPVAAEAREAWRLREERFAPLRRSLPPGTVVAYQPSFEHPPLVWSRLHEAQFAGAPVILTDSWYAGTDLVLLDMHDDAALAGFMQEHAWRMVAHLGPGLAVLRRAAQVIPSEADGMAR